MRITKGNLVVVLSGNYKGVGPVGVNSVDYGDGLVLIDGVNKRLKHVKRGHSKSPQGGRIEVCLPIHISNVAVYCKVCDKGVRVKCRVSEGKKNRVCCGCGSQI